MTKTKTKGRKEGHCTICGKYGVLTADHVPPKGCIEVGAVEINSFRSALKQEKCLPKYFMNGVKFKTICSPCNNDRLGGLYDNEIKLFVEQVVSYYRSILVTGLILPSQQQIKIKPHRLARAVIGHLLAARLDPNIPQNPLGSPFDNTLREYFLDLNKNIPREISIYYWLYPSKNQLILKGFGISQLGTRSSIFGHILKFYPVSFLVVYKQPDNAKINHDRLEVEKCNSIDEERIINLSYKNIPPTNWPEKPRDDEILMFNC
jgi:hypothetical protein